MFLLPFWVIALFVIAAVEMQVFLWAADPGQFATTDPTMKFFVVVIALLVFPLSIVVYFVGGVIGAVKGKTG